jgi:hypothetical protein
LIFYAYGILVKSHTKSKIFPKLREIARTL